jgi:hypothetical protein
MRNQFPVLQRVPSHHAPPQRAQPLAVCFSKQRKQKQELRQWPI